MPLKINKAQEPARTAATFKATGSIMVGKDEDHAQGLAERSVNATIVPPSPGNSDHQEQGGPSAGSRILTDNDQREGLEETDPQSPKADDQHKL